MSRYQPYSNYKDSGVEWLGEVPEHWLSKRLKYHARIKNGQDQKKVLSDNGQYPVYGSGGEFGRANEYLYNKPSVLLGRKGTIDKPLFIIEPFWTVDTMYYTDIAKTTFQKFLYYSCLTIKFDYYQYGSAVPSMTQENLHNIDFATPSYEEQTAIANFLDIQTSKIDTLIAKQERMIELLGEKRSAMISHAVTKGLDLHVKMKDSGVEWLGEVPEHWEVKKTKTFFKLITQPAPVNNDYELLSIYTDIGVRPRKDLEAKGNKASTTDSYWMVEKGDLIVNKLLAWMGAIGYSAYDGVTSPAYDILRPSSEVNSMFYHYLFRTKIAQQEFKRWSRGIMEMRLRLYFDELGNLPMPVPPKEEQNQIIDYIQTAELKIDTLISKAQQTIELMKERRTALISAAVTGKIDVRGNIS